MISAVNDFQPNGFVVHYQPWIVFILLFFFPLTYNKRCNGQLTS